MYYFTNSCGNNFGKNNPVLLSSHMLLCYKRWYVGFLCSVQMEVKVTIFDITNPI